MAHKSKGDRPSNGALGKGKAKKRAKSAGQRLVDYRQMYALSKKERVDILAVLCERVASPKELSDELNEGLSQVSYHVGVLRRCRLIALVNTEPRRGAVEHYTAVSPTLVPHDAWDHLPPSVRKMISANIIDEFVEDAAASLVAGTFDEAPGELAWTPLILDRAGVNEFGHLSREFLKSVGELQARASKRLSKDKGKKALGLRTATVFLASFLSARSPKDGKKASAAKRR